MSNMMDLKDFIDEGYLQEANRQFFHPLGLALMVMVDEDHPDENNNAESWGICDNRGDGAGMTFAPGSIDEEKAAMVEDRLDDAVVRRSAKYGFVVQPVKEKS